MPVVLCSCIYYVFFNASGALVMYTLCGFFCSGCSMPVVLCSCIYYAFFLRLFNANSSLFMYKLCGFFSGCSMPVVLCSCIYYVFFSQAVQCQWCFVHVYIMYFFLRLFNASGAEVKSSSFPPGGSYQPSQGDGSLDIMGNRITTLGTNM